VMTPICGPSRSALLSGRYPHSNGIMGHGDQPPELWQQPEVLTPTITRYLREAGYTTGAILKARRARFNVWDVVYLESPFGVGHHDRNPASFYERTKAFIASARERGKPFFLYANPIDPHRPWVDTEQEATMQSTWNPDRPYPEPSRRYGAEDVEVPEFLPDLPDIRDNLVPYYESLHRGDECIGAILRALEESGESENTLVVFLSDNGMGAIGAKATLYQAGLRTPIIVRWPGVVEAGVVDDESVISSIDIMPTVLDAVGMSAVAGIEGQSFVEVLNGGAPTAQRQYAYAASNYSGSSRPEHFLPQRAIIDKEYLYVWNSYVIRSKGRQRFQTSWIDVVQSSLNADHPRLLAKIEAIINKPAEELFDLTNDPGCWDNLAQDPAHVGTLNEYRMKLSSEMESTSDPEWPLFEKQRQRVPLSE